jgi:hypothetical protein
MLRRAWRQIRERLARNVWTWAESREWVALVIRECEGALTADERARLDALTAKRRRLG